MKTLFRNATIIDGRGREPIMNADILVEGERILEIGSVDPSRVGQVDIIDLSGKHLIPGIINTHIHINADASLSDSLFRSAVESETLTAYRSLNNLEKLLKSGVTYARDLGGKNHSNIEVRNALRMGLVEGCELHSSGEAITTTGGHAWKISRECDGVSEVQKAVREQLKAGADCIKILITGGHGTPGVHPKALQFTFDEIKAAVELAHFANKPIAAHTNGLEAIRMAVKAGIDSIEHCEFFPDDPIDEVNEVIQMMVEQGTYYVPTFSTWFKEYPFDYSYYGEIEEEALDKLYLRQPDHIRPMNMEREYFTMHQIIENGKRMYEAGVKTVMGTDSGVITVHFDKHPFEMKLMELMGMSKLEVIKASTKTSAELLGIQSDYGTLEKGKKADFVVLNSDPLENMDALYDVEMVVKLGKIVK